MKKLFIIAIPLIIIVILSGCIFEPYTYFKQWLCAVNIDGTDLQYLIEEDIGIFIPNLDGTKLIGYYNHEIYSMNPDGTGKEILVEYIDKYLNPEIAMTPEGEMIVFDIVTDIYTLNLSNNDLERLTEPDTIAYIYPSFSSNGEKICCSTTDFDSVTSICIMDYNGENKQMIYSYIVDQISMLRSPYFTNSDNQIIYASPILPDSWGIYSVSIDGTNNHKIFDQYVPFSMSHNGLFLVLSAENVIYKMNSDGSGLIELATTYQDQYAPVTSPDDSLILYPSTNSTMYIMNNDGSNKREVSDMEYDLDNHGYKSYNFRFINNERVIVKLRKWYET
jgi:Tol biopolymer transport system component